MNFKQFSERRRSQQILCWSDGWLPRQPGKWVSTRHPQNPLHPLGSQQVREIPLHSFGAKPRESVTKEAGEQTRTVAGK